MRSAKYIVIPANAPHPELWKRADQLTERRARKRVGIAPDAPFGGRIRNEPVHPLDILPQRPTRAGRYVTITAVELPA